MENLIIQNLHAVRTKNPLVHNITNFVVMNNTANALLAIGASPVMIHAHKEVENIVKISNALVINIGTLDDYWAESMLIAAKKADQLNKPWVLDPVGAGISTFRNELIKELLRYHPTVIRGNASEILTLDTFEAVQGKGVDSTHQSNQAIKAAHNLNQKIGSVVCISGASDFIVSNNPIIEIKNGHELMTKVTGLGCSATASIGAFIGLNKNPFLETVSGMAIFSLAGELAQKKSNGPGTLQMNLYDTLYHISAEEIQTNLKISVYED
ncbi:MULTISPECIES: hydroxyethylthiazole kinase [Empedobacter]|uniref:Hydroxyethylthiazole kinase n=1 Tax=Empedobacter falsenii TaxID=343874 RepID=A0A427BPH1_9FLAO|nr:MULTISPECIES: hydroxyethylthiazole kinase [Empedobacter]MBW1618009.1 hydroxyethylthiazole kinase [Empedobacter falsenii]MDH0658539.1 hydroxyethylthiazole kinase [Empedobacter sp. GD03865]MDH0674484.1 hydroxyethylthiazole kinase [Empedobacter sp. GD03861]MDH1602864.1 hydroxyethylthiazole kinase [Empedobacter sp. GD03739]MDM1040702.1 hydroxyethylthiazole kinase [Empedobacter brevis]